MPRLTKTRVNPIEEKKKRQKVLIDLANQRNNVAPATRNQEGAPKRGVRFNNDGTVDVTVGKTTQRLTKEQYDAPIKFARGNKGNAPLPTATPERQALAQAEQQFVPGTNEIDPRIQLEQTPTTAPPLLAPDKQKASFDLLDVGTVLGGTVAGAGAGATAGAAGGAAIGSLVPGIGTAAGAAAGAQILGGIGAAIGFGTSLYQASAGERRQNVKAGKEKFKESSTNMDKIINSVNAGQMSNQQANANWDYEKELVFQAEREIKNQGEGLFGEKLAKNTDELEEIYAWRRRLAQLEFEFEQAKLNPDPSKIKIINTPTEITQENVGN